MYHVCAACATDDSARVKCWGRGVEGQTGQGNQENIGDDELPVSVGDLPFSTRVLDIAAGERHSCISLEEGIVCWGQGGHGKLGNASLTNTGDDEDIQALTPIALKTPAVALALGKEHSCALLEQGEVWCWGDRNMLGYAALEDIGDDEFAGEGQPVDLGGQATSIDAGTYHTCALLTTGSVRCWGVELDGQLGYGDKDFTAPPSLAGDVTIGGSAIAIGVGSFHSCAVLMDGKVQCWGVNEFGQLGLGYTSLLMRIGDDESPASAGPVLVPQTISAVAAGDQHTCAQTNDGEVLCWGARGRGQRGHGGKDLGPDPIDPSSSGLVDLGGKTKQLRAGGDANCTISQTGQIRCWGYNIYGKLGLGHEENIGDDEVPATSPPVNVF